MQPGLQKVEIMLLYLIPEYLYYAVSISAYPEVEICLKVSSQSVNKISV